MWPLNPRNSTFTSLSPSADSSPSLSTSSFILFLFLFIFYLFMAVLGLRFCARAFSSCGKRGPLFIAVRGPLTIAASLVAEHRLQTRRLSNCGSRAQLLCGMWDLPRPGLGPVSPALAGRLPTTAPPGKPSTSSFSLRQSPCYRLLFPSPLFPRQRSEHLVLFGLPLNCCFPGAVFADLQD